MLASVILFPNRDWDCHHYLLHPNLTSCFFLLALPLLCFEIAQQSGEEAGKSKEKEARSSRNQAVLFWLSCSTPVCCSI